MEVAKKSTVTPVLQRQVAVAPPVKSVSRMRGTLQPSLNVSSPSDSSEVEAVSIAKTVMRMPASDNSISYGSSGTGKVFRFQNNLHREKIQREGSGVPSVSPALQSKIQASSSEGSPLPAGVKNFMEPRFKADFSNVKIHTSEKSAGMNAQLSARAFTVGNNIFFGKDQFKPEQNDGKELIAHELTHTIQQGAAIQRSEDVAVSQSSTTQVQRLGLSDALNFFANKANFIPGFRMFTIILGMNPINMSRVDRSAANILRAVIELLPGGALITQALDNHGIIEKVAAWIEQQINTLGMVGSSFKKALSDFMDTLSWSDIFDLGGVWERAKRIFTEPIDRIINFGKGLITGIIKFIKDAILKPLAKLAEGTAGYDLLKAVLGQDPVTGEPVPRTAENIIGGFMKMIGQEEVWENIKKGNAIAKAWAWFQGALAGLMEFVHSIPKKIVDTITSLTITDVVTVVGAFSKIGSAFVSIVVNFTKWAVDQVLTLLEILISVVRPEILVYIKKAQSAFATIVKNPVAFVGNLVKAGKLGFEKFASNIGEHLKTALIKWLTGPLGDAGVYIPKSFSLMEIIKLVLSVLGLTWQNIRSKLVKIIPEPVLVVLEKTAGVLVTLVKDGPAAAWDQIKTELTELKDQLIGQVTQMVTSEIVKAAVLKVVSMLNPAGAVIQAILAIYNTVTFFVEKIKQIGAVVASFIDSIAEIASGMVENAAKKVEQTMANTLTIIIAFLAKFVGLGNVPEKLVGVIKKIRQPIDKGLDKIVGWLGKMLEKAVSAVKKTVAKLIQWWKVRKNFTADGESHSLSFSGEKSSARLIVASDPVPLSQFIAEKRNDPKADKSKLSKIESEIKKIEAAKKLPEEKNEETQKQIEAAMQIIIPILVFLLDGTDYGSTVNPLPIEYTKRRAGKYPTIYIGPKSTKRIEQNLLESAKSGSQSSIDKIKKTLNPSELSEWGGRNFEIKICYPTRNTTLPDGTVIGISEVFQVDTGTRIDYSEGKTKGGSLINNVLKPYGFSAGEEKYDGDHIIEMQIGGPNELRNLWPLDRGENRSSGSLLKNLITDSKKKVKPNKKSAVNKNRFFILIEKTRS